MLAVSVVEQIEGLLREGRLSQRQIAQRLGVSRGSVAAIALGRHRRRPARSAGADFLFPSGVPRRCPGCGGMVQMPCLLCRIRAAKERNLGRQARPNRQFSVANP
jgi:hypothetical protein